MEYRNGIPDLLHTRGGGVGHPPPSMVRLDEVWRAEMAW